MIQYLSDSTATQLMSALSSLYVIVTGDGDAQIITGPLPGKAVCALMEASGVLYVIVDLEKPMAHRHARQMIREWRAGQAKIALDSPIDLVPDTPEPQGPCALSLVS